MHSTNTTDGALGNAKLKGKISGRMNCKCCTATNFKGSSEYSVLNLKYNI